MMTRGLAVPSQKSTGIYSHGYGQSRQPGVKRQGFGVPASPCFGPLKPVFGVLGPPSHVCSATKDVPGIPGFTNKNMQSSRLSPCPLGR